MTHQWGFKYKAQPHLFCTFRALSVSKGQGRTLPEQRRGEQSHVQNTDKNSTTFSLSLLSQKNVGERYGNNGEYISLSGTFNLQLCLSTNAMGGGCIVFQYFGTHYFAHLFY